MHHLSKCRRTAILALLTAGIFLLALPAVEFAHAQETAPDTRFGVRIGPNFATLTGSWVQPEGFFIEAEIGPRTGLALGGYAVVPLSGEFFIQPEVMYIQKGTRFEIVGLASATGANRISYLEVPILLRFEIPIEEELQDIQIQPYVVGGPTAGFKLSAGSEANGNAVVEQDFGDVTKTFNFGLTAGAGVEYGIDAGTVVAEARYALGVSDVLSLANESARTRGIMITLGIIF